MKKKRAVGLAAVGSLAIGGVLVGLGQTNPDDPKFNEGDPGVSVQSVIGDDKKDAPAKAKSADEKAKIEVKADAVKNLTDNRSDVIADYCRNSKLPAGEGKDNKGGTCVSYPLGEIAKNPVLVSIPNQPSIVPAGKDVELDIKIEDKFGPLDLNAFTHDKNDKAGDTFLEHPGELDKQGRPLVHAHLGVTTLSGKHGVPGQTYDAAFLGLNGLKGDIKATIKGLDVGFYRVDVYAGQPGHAPIPTAKADFTQAFTSFELQVN